MRQWVLWNQLAQRGNLMSNVMRDVQVQPGRGSAPLRHSMRNTGKLTSCRHLEDLVELGNTVRPSYYQQVGCQGSRLNAPAGDGC